ncbi:MAG: hypothetical protein U1E36_03935 [Rickettsiales bacterium]
MNVAVQQPMYYMMPPAGAGAVQSADTAAPVVPAAASAPMQQTTITDTALQFGEMGAGFAAQAGKLTGPMGMIFAPVTVGLNAINSSREAYRGMDALKEQFRSEVAEKLGISAEDVNEAALRKVAGQIPALKQSIDAYDGMRVASPVKATASLGVGASTALIGTALGGPIGMVAGLAAGFAASTLADKAADKLAESAGVIPPEHTACAKINEINAKLQNGEHISPRDVFAVFAKSDHELGGLVRERAGTDVEGVNALTLQHIMEKYHPNLTKSCKYLADQINLGQRKPEILAFINPKELAQEKWISTQQANDFNSYPQGQNMAVFNPSVNTNTVPQPVIYGSELSYQGKGVPMMPGYVVAGSPVVGAYTQQLANSPQPGIQQPQRG